MIDNLTQIANELGTDKGDKHFEAHNYTKIYEELFKDFKDKAIHFLEIGIADPSFPGASLKMWSKWFINKHFKLIGFDIVNCTQFKSIDKRIEIEVGDQGSITDLIKVTDKHKFFQIVLDDGSHFHEHHINCFTHLIKYVDNGGLYIIEDLHAHDGYKTIEWFQNNNFKFELFNNNKLMVIYA